MPLYHWEVCLEADPSARYIPFDGQAPGSVFGKHSIRLGCENDYPHAKKYALSIFPLARIVAVYETNILGDRIRQVEALKDSPELAIRDKAITNLHYHEGQFRQFFTSPFEQYAEHIGKPFTVVKETRPGKPETDESEAEDDMYLIRFEDGTEIEAFGHEVCVLDYEKCLPKFETPA